MATFNRKLLSQLDGIDGKRLLMICFITALILRLLTIAIWGNFDGSGQYEHGEIARNMLNGHGFTMHWPYAPVDVERAALKEHPPTHGSAFLPPLGPIIIASAIFVFGDGWVAALALLIFYALVSAAQTPLAYAICLRMGSGVRSAKIAACIAAFFPPTIAAVASFSGSPLYQTLAMAVIFLAIKLKAAPSFKLAALTGLTLATLILLRAEFIAFGPIILFIALWPHLRNNFRQTLKLILPLALPVVLLIGPWLLRNYTVFNRPVGMSSHPWNEIWRGTNPHATGSSYDVHGRPVWVGYGPWKDIAVRMDSLPYDASFELAVDSLQREIVLDFIREEPAHAAKLFAAKFAMVWTFDWYAPKGRNVLYIVPTLLMLVSFWLGMWRLRREERWNDLLLFLAFVAMYTALFTLTHMEPRYQIYMMSCMPPVAALGLERLLVRGVKT